MFSLYKMSCLVELFPPNLFTPVYYLKFTMKLNIVYWYAWYFHCYVTNAQQSNFNGCSKICPWKLYLLLQNVPQFLVTSTIILKHLNIFF